MPIVGLNDISHESQCRVRRTYEIFNYHHKIVNFWDREFKQKPQYPPRGVLFFVFLNLSGISNGYLAISVRRTCVIFEYRSKIVICCHSDFKQKLKYSPLTGLFFVFLHWSRMSNSYFAISEFIDFRLDFFHVDKDYGLHNGRRNMKLTSYRR